MVDGGRAKKKKRKIVYGWAQEAKRLFVVCIFTRPRT